MILLRLWAQVRTLLDLEAGPARSTKDRDGGGGGRGRSGSSRSSSSSSSGGGGGGGGGGAVRFPCPRGFGLSEASVLSLLGALGRLAGAARRVNEDRPLRQALAR